MNKLLLFMPISVIKLPKYTIVFRRKKISRPRVLVSIKIILLLTLI